MRSRTVIARCAPVVAAIAATPASTRATIHAISQAGEQEHHREGEQCGGEHVLDPDRRRVLDTGLGRDPRGDDPREQAVEGVSGGPNAAPAPTRTVRIGRIQAWRNTNAARRMTATNP